MRLLLYVYFYVVYRTAADAFVFTLSPRSHYLGPGAPTLAGQPSKLSPSSLTRIHPCHQPRPPRSHHRPHTPRRATLCSHARLQAVRESVCSSIESQTWTRAASQLGFVSDSFALDLGRTSFNGGNPIPSPSLIIRFQFQSSVCSCQKAAKSPSLRKDKPDGKHLEISRR
ncbi:hypothetical protein V8C44DRAFT_248891 [Trichoderma aethiopicum]